MTDSPQGAGTQDGISLPGLLNILYRGRRIIFYVTLLGMLAGVGYGLFTKPLYRSTAQVRAGIVAYAAHGGGVREWAMKDIVRWFRTGMYWEDLRDLDDYQDYKIAPIILADFIPSGPQFMQGGDVITLTNLSPEPLHSIDILNRAINSFNTQASMDSLGSTMYLTLGGARVRMAKIRNDINQVTADEERTQLQIEQKKRELGLVDAESAALNLKLRQIESENKWRLSAIDATYLEMEKAKKRLGQGQEMLDLLLEKERVSSPDNSVSDDPSVEILLQSARRLQAGQVGDLLNTVADLSTFIYESGVKADTLSSRVTILKLATERLILERDVDLATKKEDVQQNIDELGIVLARDLPYKRSQLEADWEAEKVLADLIIPLEKIGRITVSDKPVRPRKLRAAVILTVLAFMVSLFLVLVLEYYRNNRHAITASGRNR